MLLKSLFLGLLQGATEFLPISSSGHLVLLGRILGLEMNESLVILFHLGSLFAILTFLWLRRKEFSLSRIVKIGTASLVTFFLYCGWKLLGTGDVETILPLYLSFAFNALALWAGTRLSKKNTKQLSIFSSSLLYGFAQFLGIFPGISRSGTTWVGGVVSGDAPEEALINSFAMGAVAILGGAVLKWKEVSVSLPLNSATVAVASAAVSSYFCMLWATKLVRKGGFYIFAVYTGLLSVICLTLGW